MTALRIRTTLLTLAAFALSAAHLRAQAVWTNADDRDYSGNPPVLNAAFWSFGYVAPDSNGNGGHAGNWSGSTVPGTDLSGNFHGPLSVQLGSPGNTICDVEVSLSSLALVPGGALSMQFNSSLSVASTAISTDGEITIGGGSGAFPTYTNTGTLTKSAGTGASSFDPGIIFSSMGGTTIAVQSGTLLLPGGNGLLDTVTFAPAAGTLIDIVGVGNYGSGNRFNGTLSNSLGAVGTVRFSQGQMAAEGYSVSSVVTLAFTGNVFQWTGGNIGAGQSPSPFNNTGVVNVVGTNSPTVYANFTNQASMIQTGMGGIVLGSGNSGGTLTNAAGATFDLQSDAGIHWGGGNGNYFTNVGRLEKSSGTGTSTIDPGLTFNNQGGTIEVDSGTLLLTGTGTDTGGTYNVPNAGAVLDLVAANGYRHFTGAFAGSGNGTVQLSQGVLGRNSDDAITWNFLGDLFQWTGGTIGDGGQPSFTNNGTINISGDNGKQNFAIVTNTGTIIHTGAGNLSVGTYHNGGSLTNSVGALYDLRSDAGLTTDFGNTFTNAGLFEKTGGTGTSTISCVLTNPGTLSVYTGTMLFSAQYNNGTTDISGTTLTEGTWNIFDGAALVFSSYGTVTTNQANVILSGPNSSFPAINSLSDNQGSFSLLALRQFMTMGALSNEGNLSIDAGATLHVAGTFTASGTNASLAITVGGTATSGAASPGILQVNGTATVAGNLSVAFGASATLPGLSDTLTIVSAAAPISGSFANVVSGARVNTADGKGSFLVTYGTGSSAPNAVTLSQFSATGSSVPPNLPIITLTPLQPNAYANQGIIGTLQLTRTGDLSQDLHVNLQFKGTGVDGTDYVLLKTSKKVPAGKSTKPIKIIPIDESYYPGGKKTVKIVVLPGDGYTVGSATTAKVKIFYDR